MPRTRLLPPTLASIRTACMWVRAAWGHLGYCTRRWLANILLGLASIRAACTRLLGAWGHLGHRNRHWIINFLIGIAIEIVLMAAHNAPIVIAAQNWALDTAMQGNAEVHALRGSDVTSRELAFIDVDEETWRNPLWGNAEPFHAPRAGLLTLIDYAIGEARYIVLDVIIESRNDPEDEWFASEIEKRVTKLKPDQHILFVRTLREPLNGMQNLLAPEIRPSPLDDVIKSYPKQLHAVAPYFHVSRDGVLRDWEMWRAGCRRDPGTGKGHWEILPSVQFAIAALIRSNDAQRAKFPWNQPAKTDPCIVDLAAVALPDVPASKVRPNDAPVWNWLRSRPDLTHVSELAEPNDASFVLNNRIFFRYRYRQEISPVRLIPALAVLKHAPHMDIAANGIVVIGQSFEAARDQHATPLGVMPGGMVLINSVESMLNPGLLQEPGWAGWLAIEGTSIALVGFVLAYLDYVIAVIVILTLFIPLLIIANYFLLLWGIWMDFAVPLLGMYAHKIIAEFDAYLPRRRDRRHDTHVHPNRAD